MATGTTSGGLAQNRIIPAGIYVGTGAITLPVVVQTRVPRKSTFASGSAPMPPQNRGWYKRRLPLRTAIPGGGGTYAAPAPALILRPLVIRSDRGRKAAVFWERPPLSPPLVTPTGRIIRPVVIRGEAAGFEGAVYPVRPPHAPTFKAVILPLVVRSDHERGGTVIQVRPPLKPPAAGVSGYAVLLEPLVVRSDSRRAGSVVWERPPFLPPPPPVPGFAVLLEPVVVRSDHTRPGLVYWERPPFLPPAPSIPGFAVLLQPKVIIGPRPPKGVGILEGLVRLSVYPPTPTGIVGPRLQFYRGPEADRPNLLIAEPAWTIDAHGLWVGDGTYDRFIGGDLVSPPAHSNSAGTMGQCAWDGTYFYRCVATNTWIRIAGITSW